MQEISATKQKILIIGLVGVFILAVVMITVMFFGTKKSNEQIVDNSIQPNKENNQEKISQTEKKSEESKVIGKDNKFLQLATNDVYGLKIKQGTNQAMFYQRQKILAADPFSGKKNSLGSYPFVKVTEFLWSKDGSKAIVKDVGEYYIYEANSNLAHKLEWDMDVAIWNKEGDKIIYKYYDQNANERKIAIKTVNGEDAKIIKQGIPYRKINLLTQPATNNICYYPYPDARVKGKLFCEGLDKKNKKEYGGKYGEDYLWSPDGNKLLTSFTKEKSGNQLVLGVMRKFGGEIKDLSMGTTVRKCVWSKNSIDVYCAVLGGAPLDIMLPNAWDEQIFNSADTFWKINTETGQKKRIISLEGMIFAIDSENLIIDPEEEFLFFISRRDQSLWRLKL